MCALQGTIMQASRVNDFFKITKNHYGSCYNPLHFFFSIFFSVLVSSGETLNRGFHNIGSIFFDIKALSNSLGTGLDKLDEKPNKLHIPRNKVARSVNKPDFKFCLFVFTQ